MKSSKSTSFGSLKKKPTIKGSKRRQSKHFSPAEKRKLFKTKRKSTLPGILDSIVESEKWLTDEPSVVLIGLDDLDEDVLERFDYMEAKLKDIEDTSKSAQALLFKLEGELTRKMRATLADVNTIKEKIVQIVKTVKRDKYEILHMADTLRNDMS